MILDQIPHFPPKQKHYHHHHHALFTSNNNKKKKKTRLYCHLTVQQSPDKPRMYMVAGLRTPKPKTTQMPEAKTLGEKTQKH